ncbi:MAG TPA: ATP-dependent DNA helicase, partial [Candidatus Acidoferrum sp.]
ERFAGWKTGRDSTKYRVTLTENYRSTPNILRVATQVIAQNEVSSDFPNKVLSATHPEGERIRIAELSNEDEEATWVASELERLHRAGTPWRDFAILYRQHNHRDRLAKELAERNIPFVISRLSILEHPLVRDVLAYLRVINKPFDDIAAARVLAAPAWHLEPVDLVRLAERTRKKRTSIYDTLQSPQSDLPFDPSPKALADLLEFIAAQRKNLKRRPAIDVLRSLIDWLEIPHLVGPRARRYVTQLVEFLKTWEPKSDTKSLPEFLEYLDYFEQSGLGTICLDDEAPGDSVQLMTVHGAKGLEFPHVFLLRVNHGCFPAKERSPLFEFPVKLMKEDLPAGNFHIQEERRLFYVALTRAERKLTITTLTEKKGKVPTFIEDILMDPTVRKRDVLQISPKVKVRNAGEGDASGKNATTLFPSQSARPRIFSQICDWAETYHPPTPEPLKLSASAVDSYRKCPQLFLFSRLWSLKEGPAASLSFGAVMHTTVRRFIDQFRKGVKLPFEEVVRVFETEWTSAGYEDEYQESEYKKDGIEQLRVFHADFLANPPEVLEQEKSFELPLENNVIINGRIDQINSLGKKDVEIIDYKTGKSRKEADARRDLQLSIYAIAAKEILELNPVRLAFHYLQNNQVQSTTRTDKQLDEAQKVVQEAAADIRAAEFSPKRGFSCRGCAYKPVCPAYEESLGT